MIFVCILPINKIKDYLYSIMSLQSSGSPYRVCQIMVLIKRVSKTKCPLFYIYLSFDVYKIFTTSFQAFYCTNEKGKCEKIFFCNYDQATLVNTSTSDHEKHRKVRQHWRQKRKKHVYAYNELKVTVI